MVILLADSAATTTVDDGRLATNKNRVAARDAVRHNWQERRRSVRRVPPPSSASVCYIVKNTWIHLWDNFLVDKQSQRTSPTTTNVDSKEATRNSVKDTNADKRSRLGQRNQFPSVVSIMQKNEIFRQVQSLQDEALFNEVLSVLPTEYDWAKAIQDTASRRSRAFWLLDLSVIMRNVFTFRNHGIQCVYDVQRSTNADPILLKVLLRSKVVTLATTTKWDLERCRNVIEKDAFSEELVQDSTTCCGKPDGYIREWIRAHDNNQHGPLVVDGAEEVIRVSETVKRMRQRDSRAARYQENCFVLRFETANPDDWRHIAHETASRLKDCCGRLAGLSFEVPVGERAAFFENLEQFLCHLSHSNYSEIKERQLNIDFNAAINAEVDDMLAVCTAWIGQIAKREDVRCIKVDVTRLLMASAGALCTRVIGVREQEVDEGIRMHYYIDDGCYGSLCAKGDSLTPLPLFSRERSSEQRHETTIWGPTCDGLDKVCERIRLPLLQRDDWLVFAETHSGSEGLSTAFNGFDPPDTAYCVLGYFGNH